MIALVVTFVAVIGHGDTTAVTGTPRQIMLALASRTEAPNTVHMKFTISFSGTPSFLGHSGKPVSISVNGTEAVNFASKSATLTVRAPKASGKGTEVIQERVIGPTLYLSAPGLMKADGGKPWVLVGLAQYEKKTGQTAELTSSEFTTQMLGAIRKDASHVTNLGPATIDGVATTHYRVMMTETSTGTSSAAPVSGITGLPLDVWVDRQGRLSQLRLQLPLFGIDLAETMTLSAYGSPVSVTPPPASKTANGAGLLKSGQLEKILNVSSGSPSSGATG